jgi:pilus assembly protein CpaF
MERLRDGNRKVVQVSEVQGMEGDTIVLQDLFYFDQTGIKNGRVIGDLKSTGLQPRFAEKFAVNGIELPLDIFGRKRILMRVGCRRSRSPLYSNISQDEI